MKRATMLIKLILLIVPSVIVAQISIDVSGTVNKNGTGLVVTVTGEETKVITKKEKQSFGLTDDKLKQGVGLIKGKDPTDVYLFSPTPWGDLYIIYKSIGFEQVKRTLKPVKYYARVKAWQPEIIDDHKFHNDDAKEGSFTIDMEHTRESSVTNGWENSESVEVGASLSVSGSIGGLGGSASVSVSYGVEWGASGSVGNSIESTTTTSLEIKVNPGQRLIGQERQIRKAFDVVIEYEATLQGKVACNYYPAYDGSHFKQVEINEVMDKLGLPRKIKVVQVISMGYVSQYYVNIIDPDDKSKRK